MHRSSPPLESSETPDERTYATGPSGPRPAPGGRRNPASERSELGLPQRGIRRRVVRLRQQGKTYPEIREALGLNTNQVRNAIRWGQNQGLILGAQVLVRRDDLRLALKNVGMDVPTVPNAVLGEALDRLKGALGDA